MSLPLTAQAQLQRAAELGHVPHLAYRGKDKHGHERYQLECSCGYQSTGFRSKRQMGKVIAWHLGKVIGLADSTSRLNGTG